MPGQALNVSSSSASHLSLSVEEGDGDGEEEGGEEDSGSGSGEHWVSWQYTGEWTVPPPVFAWVHVHVCEGGCDLV